MNNKEILEKLRELAYNISYAEFERTMDKFMEENELIGVIFAICLPELLELEDKFILDFIDRYKKEFEKHLEFFESWLK